MRNVVTCPRTGEPCDNGPCLIANESLEDVVLTFDSGHETRPKKDAVEKALKDELDDEAQSFDTDFLATFYQSGNCTICTSEVSIESLTPEETALRLAEVIRGCIETAISELLAEDLSDHYVNLGNITKRTR